MTVVRGDITVSRRSLLKASVAGASVTAAISAGGVTVTDLVMQASQAHAAPASTIHRSLIRQAGSYTVYPRVCILGDSLTWGSVASFPYNAYPYKLFEALKARDNGSMIEQWIVGVPGILTAGMTANMQQMGCIPIADLYIIELGTNDFTNNNPAATFQAQYDTVLLQALIHKAAPWATLVALGTWQDPATVNTTGAPASLYNSIIEDGVYNKAGNPIALYFDLGDFYNTPSYHNTTGDTFHPNDAGHAAIANMIMASLP